MKRIIVLLLTVALICSLQIAVSAEPNDATLSCLASGEYFSPGDEVELTVLLQNVPYAKSVALVFDYDITNTFEIAQKEDPKDSTKMVSDAEWLLAGAVLANFDDQTTSCGTAAIAYSTAANVNGTIFTLKLVVKEAAPIGKTIISITPVIKNDSITINCDPASIELNISGAKITSAALALGTDITVNYYATLSTAQADAQMRFTMNDKETVVNGTKEGNEYVFPFGVSPQCMGDNIKAELILGDEVLDTIETYSVLQNCQNLLAKNPSDELRTLIADLLEYGAMSQIYTNYKTDALVNEGITGQTVFTPLADDEANDLYVTYELSTSTNGKYELKAAGVYFDSVNRLYFKLYAEDVTDSNFEVVITDMQGNKVSRLPSEFEEIGENLYMVYTDPIYASELSFSEADEDYYWYTVSLNTVQIKKGKRVLTPVQTLDYYSLASYVYSKQNSSNAMADLAIALYNYGLSAEAYRNAQ